MNTFFTVIAGIIFGFCVGVGFQEDEMNKIHADFRSKTIKLACNNTFRGNTDQVNICIERDNFESVIPVYNHY